MAKKVFFHAFYFLSPCPILHLSPSTYKKHGHLGRVFVCGFLSTIPNVKNTAEKPCFRVFFTYLFLLSHPSPILPHTQKQGYLDRIFCVRVPLYSLYHSEYKNHGQKAVFFVFLFIFIHPFLLPHPPLIPIHTRKIWLFWPFFLCIGSSPLPIPFRT